MKFLPAVSLQALAFLTAHAGEEPPAWAMKVLSERLSTRYELVQKPEPSFYVGDFNGDGKSDVALLIKEKTTAKVGIAIIDGGESKTMPLDHLLHAVERAGRSRGDRFALEVPF